jgi:hypothetical protein
MRTREDGPPQKSSDFQGIGECRQISANPALADAPSATVSEWNWHPTFFGLKV